MAIVFSDMICNKKGSDFMTKMKRNVTIYSGVILLFGLIVMITLIVIYEQISVKSKFGEESLDLGSFVVSDLEDELDYTAFRVVDPVVFIERHITTHENYLYTIDDLLLESKYFIFQVDRSLYTLKYVKHEEMFYLYSGYYYFEHNDKTYALSYVEQESNDLSEDIFTSYEDLKLYYINLYDAIANDQLKVIRTKAYELSSDTNQIDENQAIDILIEYKDDDIVIKFP